MAAIGIPKRFGYRYIDKAVRLPLYRQYNDNTVENAMLIERVGYIYGDKAVVTFRMYCCGQR